MKKLGLALLASAMAFAIAPAALADSLNFDFVGTVSNYNTGTTYPAETVTLDGVFTTSGVPDADGGVQIASFTGTYSDPEDGVVGAVSLYPGHSTYESHLTSADGSWWFDNLYYPGLNAPNTVGGQFDYYGLLIYVGPSGDPTKWEVNFWADTSTSYEMVESLTGSGQD